MRCQLPWLNPISNAHPDQADRGSRRAVGTLLFHAFLQVPVQTLYQWRRKGFGPQARRVGKHLRWHPDVVRAWFDALER